MPILGWLSDGLEFIYPKDGSYFGLNRNLTAGIPNPLIPIDIHVSIESSIMSYSFNIMPKFINNLLGL